MYLPPRSLRGSALSILCAFFVSARLVFAPEGRAQLPWTAVKVNSDWAGSSDRRSVDCIAVRMYNVVVHISVCDQTFWALYCAEAELGGAHRGNIFAIGLQNLWHECFQATLPIDVGTDSMAGLQITSRIGVGRVRHLEIAQLFSQAGSDTGRVKYFKEKGSTNQPDIGTAVLNKERGMEQEAMLGFEAGAHLIAP